MKKFFLLVLVFCSLDAAIFGVSTAQAYGFGVYDDNLYAPGGHLGSLQINDSLYYLGQDSSDPLSIGYTGSPDPFNPRSAENNTLTITGALTYWAADGSNSGTLDIEVLMTEGFSIFSEPYSPTGTTIVRPNQANGGTLQGLHEGLVLLSNGAFRQGWAYNYGVIYPEAGWEQLRAIATFSGVSERNDTVLLNLDMRTSLGGCHTRVPEPASVLLLGFGGLSALRLRRRSTRVAQS
jgi:hypothetical protein